MQTIASRSEDVVRRFFDAYLHLRDLDKTLDCLADDIRWIGTGDFERAGRGFCDCRELLIEEFKATPGSFDVKLRNLYSVEAGEACYTDGDMSVVDPSSGKGVNVRISAMCGEVPDGRCLILGAARSSCLRTAFPAGLSAAISKRASPFISSTSSSSGTLDIVRMKILWRTREGWLKTVSIPTTATASAL